MTLAGNFLFNLMLNAVGSFWLGLATAVLLLRVGRPSRATVCIALLLLPMAKLLWDLRSGIPDTSFFWASEQGIKQRLGTFQVGFGVHPWGPSLEGHLWALNEQGRSPQSIADLASRALRARVSAYAAPALAFVVLAVSIVKCGVHAFGLWAFRTRIQALLAKEAGSEQRTLGRRTVRIRTCNAYSGVPFAAGFFRPYVVLSAALAERLDSNEREAVIQHELGHVRHFDLALLAPLELLCAFFWFVPGVSSVLAKLRGLLEQRADDCAVAAGVPREAVANALLLAAQQALEKAPAPVLGMSREPSTLRVRVQRLLAPEPARVVAPWLVVVRALFLLWLSLGALQASACGNHP